MMKAVRGDNPLLFRDWLIKDRPSVGSSCTKDESPSDREVVPAWSASWAKRQEEKGRVSMSNGYHVWVGQFGATIKTVALSASIF